MKADEKPPRRQPSTVSKDEVLRDSHGRVIDDEYVERAIESAIEHVEGREREGHD